MSYNEFIESIQTDENVQEAFFMNPESFLEINGLSIEEDDLSESEVTYADPKTFGACGAQKRC